MKLRYPYPVKVKEPTDYEEALFTESLDAVGGEVALQQQISSPLSVSELLQVAYKSRVSVCLALLHIDV